jgi:hypothetical protein
MPDLALSWRFWTTEPEFMTDDFAEAEWGEERPVSRISGAGSTGWVVAVSLIPWWQAKEADWGIGDLDFEEVVPTHRGASG